MNYIQGPRHWVSSVAAQLVCRKPGEGSVCFSAVSVAPGRLPGPCNSFRIANVSGHLQDGWMDDGWTSVGEGSLGKAFPWEIKRWVWECFILSF